jgi:hypothetical protein
MKKHYRFNSLVGFLKLADSRGNMMRLLGLTREEADYFHNLSPGKAFFMGELWIDWIEMMGGRDLFFEQSLSDMFYIFSSSPGVSLRIDDFDSFRDSFARKIGYKGRVDLFDLIVSDNSFYQKIKDKSLHDIIEKSPRWGASLFEIQALKLGSKGPEILSAGEYSWHYVGNRCSVVSMFMRNCGNINDLDKIFSSLDLNNNFGMYALKNKVGLPVMVLTAGNVFDKGIGGERSVIINAADSTNNFPTKGFLLEHLFNFAKSGGYIFAELYYYGKGEWVNRVFQYPGVDMHLGEIEDGGCQFAKVMLNSPDDEIYDDEEGEE